MTHFQMTSVSLEIRVEIREFLESNNYEYNLSEPLGYL